MKLLPIIPLFLATAISGVSAPMGILIPAYIYPSPANDSLWQEIMDAGAKVSVTAIFNPNSGPFAPSNDPGVPKAYKDNIIPRLRTAKVRAIAYVFTQYGARPIQAVKDDIQEYVKNYGAFDGFFLDQVPSPGSGTNDPVLAYYKEIYDTIKGYNASYRVVGNPGQGAAALEAYLIPATRCVDQLVSFEKDVDYATTNPLPWVRKYGASHFSNLPYNIPDSATMKSYVELAKQRNVADIYVTNDNGSWAILPSYWLEEVQKIMDLNAQEKGTELSLSKAPSGQATLAVNGSVGVIEIEYSDDLVTWTTLGAVDSTSGSSTIADPGSTTVKRRFYRPAP